MGADLVTSFGRALEWRGADGADDRRGHLAPLLVAERDRIPIQLAPAACELGLPDLRRRREASWAIPPRAATARPGWQRPFAPFADSRWCRSGRHLAVS